MKDKQIAVVTGGTGFVGSHLVDLLLNKGFEVRCITRKSSDLKWLQGKDVKIFDCGLYDKEALKVVLKDSDFVFHVAGVVKSKTKEGYFKGNVETTKNLIDATLDSGTNLKRFLIVSSQTVTGPSYDGRPVNEETECRPITTYGKSKLEEEKLVLSYKDKLPITICRAPAVYGERDTEIFIYFKTFNKGITTTIGFNEKKLSLIHVLDLVNGFYLAATKDVAKGKIYFISSEEFYTWPQINDITAKIIGKKPIVVKVPHFLVYTIATIAQLVSLFNSKPATLNIEKAKDITQQYWICDTSKAIRELGYHQNISIEDGIKRTIEWYKQMKWI